MAFLFSELFETYPDPMWIYDTETLQFLEINIAAASYYGYSREEFLSMSVKDIRPEEDVPKFITVTQTLKEGLSDTGRWRHCGRDGSILHVSIHSHSIDYHGRKARFVIARDLTKMVNLEQENRALLENEDRLKKEAEKSAELLRVAEQSARLGGWYVDLDNGEVTWSDVTAAIHGEPPGTIPSLEKALSYYAPEYRGRLEHVFNACVNDGISFDEVLQIITRQDKRLWVRAIGESVRNADGRIIGAQGAFQDISELMSAREMGQRASNRLQEVLENISDAFMTLDKEWTFTFVNREAYRVLGRDAGSLLGRNVWMEFPEAVGSTFEKQYRYALDNLVVTSFEEHYPPLSKWFEVKAYPSSDGLAIYFRDVSARKREEFIRASEAKILKQISSGSPLVPILEEISRAVEMANPGTFSSILLLDEDGVTLRHGAAPSLPQSYIEGVDGQTAGKQAGSCGTAVYRQSQVIVEDIERDPLWERYRELAVTHGLRSCWSSPIFDSEGRVIATFATYRSVPHRPTEEELELTLRFNHLISVGIERARKDQALRESEERFRLIAKSTVDVIWDWDLKTSVVWWSDGYQALFGYGPGVSDNEIQRWRSRIHIEDDMRVWNGLNEVVDGLRNEWSDEYRFHRADSSWARVIHRAALIRSQDGTPARVLGTISDVTEQRRLEDHLRQSQRLDAIGQLTGGIAHDFNNLLTVILGNAETLSDRLMSDQELGALAEMTRAAAERGAELTNRLLAFSRRQALDPKAIDVNRLVGGMDALLRRTLGEQIEIEVVRGGGVWEALVDASQLENAILNLCINARDAMPDGGRLTIETANSRLDDDYANQFDDVTPGQYVMIAVSDTGSGMTADTLAKAFEPFFTTKGVGKGSGLGLSMVYGFVKQSRGHVRIYTELGQGTVVKLYLPRADATSDRSIQSVTVSRTFPIGREKILLVEDDDLVRSHVVSQLSGLGYTVVAARNGQEAIAILRQIPDFDLLFTDVVMPGGLNGPQLAEQAKALYPLLPVLFTSGYTENAIVHHGRLDRGVNLLNKPYRLKDLASKIRSVLDSNRN